jgi:hypothetical protein
MKDMSSGELSLRGFGSAEDETAEPVETQFRKAHDILYYRTKWPWPLKDRDYTLARRCKIFQKQNTIMFISRSVEVQ